MVRSDTQDPRSHRWSWRPRTLPAPRGANATAEAGDRRGQTSADPPHADPEEQAASIERLLEEVRVQSQYRPVRAQQRQYTRAQLTPALPVRSAVCDKSPCAGSR